MSQPPGPQPTGLAIAPSAPPGGTIALVRDDWVNFEGRDDGFSISTIVLVSPDRPGESSPVSGLCERSPAWSPDGSALAFVWCGGPGFREPLYRVNWDGSGLVALTDGSGDDLWPSWSPDGRSIAFLREAADPAGILLVRADGSGITPLWPKQLEDAVASFSWSPDGARIATVIVGSGECPEGEAAIVRADGSGVTPFDHLPADLAVRTVGWSPNAKRLAFGMVRCTDEGGLATILIDSDGSNGRTLTGYGNPAWSPDGTKLAIVGGHGLAVASGDGTGIHDVPNTAALAGAVTVGWSPDGTRLALGTNQGVYIINLDGTGLQKLTQGHDFSVTWR